MFFFTVVLESQQADILPSTHTCTHRDACTHRHTSTDTDTKQDHMCGLKAGQNKYLML